MSDSLEFKSRKEPKELCNNFGIRTAGVKHEDLVRLLRTKLQPKNEVPRSPSLRGTRNGSMKDNLPRMENHNSGGKTPIKLINVGRTPGNVLHDANGVSAAERRKKEGSKKDVSQSVRSSARHLSHADFLADENGQDAFSSADIDSLGSFAERSECSIDDIPYPFETTEFGNNTSSKAQKLEDRFHDASKRSVGRDSWAASDLSIETPPSELLLCTATGELSLFSIPDWISMSVDDPPLLDWEKFESVPTGHVLGGDELGELPIPEHIGLPDYGAMVMTEQDAPGIRSILEHNIGSLTSAGAGEDRDATNLVTSHPAAKDAKFEKLSDEEYVTSEEPISELALLPAEESVSLMLLEAGGHLPADSLDSPMLVEAGGHLPADSLDSPMLVEAGSQLPADSLDSPMLVEAGGHLPADSLDNLFKEFQEEHKDTLVIPCTLDKCVFKNNNASQVQLETEAKQEPEDGETDADTGPEADAPTEAVQLPINSPKGSAESYEEPESLDSEWTAHSLPMSIPEHIVGNNGHTGVETEESPPKVGFLLSVILWCAQLCWSSRN